MLLSRIHLSPEAVSSRDLGPMLAACVGPALALSRWASRSVSGMSNLLGARDERVSQPGYEDSESTLSNRLA